jgi:hypothetical protein
MLNKTLMSSSSISTSGMSRTWSELVVFASKLNIAKYSEDVMKPIAPSIATVASVVVSLCLSTTSTSSWSS